MITFFIILAIIFEYIKIIALSFLIAFVLYGFIYFLAYILFLFDRKDD